MDIYFVHILVVCFLTVDIISPAVIPSQDKVVRSESKLWDGQEYSFGYQTKNGVKWKQSGTLRTSDNGNTYVGVTGKYFYPLDNRLLMSVEYEANDKGYQVKHFRLIPYKVTVINKDKQTDDKILTKNANGETSADSQENYDDIILDIRVTDARATATLLG